ncbi:MAG: cysteine hydrolase [Cyanobacteria bacterium REEB67]|nr:cysteine hydrolase [Cyanobacteria bacterium REEB67]
MSGTALLLMDLQNAIIDRLGENGDYIGRLQQVARAARTAGVTVIYVVVKFRQDLPEISANNKAFSQIKAANMPFTEGNATTEIHPAFAPERGDIIVTKRRVSAFSGSDLDVVLRGKNIDHLVLTGLATSGVVLSTLRFAADLDFKMTVLADCCADRDEEVHRVLTEKIFPSQAEVISGGAWIEIISRQTTANLTAK